MVRSLARHETHESRRVRTALALGALPSVRPGGCRTWLAEQFGGLPTTSRLLYALEAHAAAFAFAEVAKVILQMLKDTPPITNFDPPMAATM
jgi:hypothetical protein